MPTALAIPDVTPAQLARYATLIYEKIGVTISASKSTLLSNRLRRRLRATGETDYDSYFKRLVSASITDDEWQAFLQEITTHETYLYRDEAHWNWFRDEFLRRMRAEATSGARNKTLRCWSAASSTGDEAATMACCIGDVLTDLPSWKIEIVGTDVGAGAVAQASLARFGVRAMRNVKTAQKRAHFEALPTGDYALKPHLKSLLRFQVHNLLHPLKERAFDIVFLKNVLIYFDKDSKRRVVESLKTVLRPGSILVTGGSEGVADLLKDFKSLQPWLHCFAPTIRS
jgi:chemotaxis protein methyltransferase CheR